ncbi:ComF family protein [Streptococcus cuniculi]|uniref:ComF family protein n=1 Tax=Streptococcus cuniculi TaxID=1432788 RepID=A0A4Y9JCR5_9STRE|nr:ComF family protein [Streptococcus cuniculi]MBF0778458.1 ComF family protein [Streptococcus cuniculi]TFU97739.1 ComF family protein [Streptococcus cuniculi]
MALCLLCQQTLKKRVLFSDILLLKKEREGICLDCRQGFSPISDIHCPTCFKEGEKNVCSDCLYWEKQGAAVSHESLYRYNEHMADYFSRYKFVGDYLLRTVFATELQTYFKDKRGYAFVPIPISDKRMAERGFNQVTGLLSSAGLSFQEILQKEDTKKQSDKTRQERLELKQPFSIVENTAVPENIILIDDIYTTGSTVQLAKQVLMKNGAKIVASFSLAR